MNLYQEIFFPIIKRIIDIILSLILLIFLFPIFVLIFIIIFLDTKQSPIFVQRRALSLNSKHFNIFKFRTLKGTININNSDKNILHKPQLEAYLTKSGKFLRKTGLDELPQLINVLKGDMSLVGPRPLSIDDLLLIKKNYPELHERRSQIKSKPGLTGFWQTSKDADLDVEYLVIIDEYYDKERALLLDFYILVNTLRVLLFARHKDGIIRNEFEPGNLEAAYFYGLGLIIIILSLLILVNFT